jgi:hypothetical protein
MVRNITTDEVKDQIKSDLKEMALYYGSWDALRKVIESLENNENEDAYEKHTSGGSDAWSGGFAENH